MPAHDEDPRALVDAHVERREKIPSAQEHHVLQLGIDRRLAQDDITRRRVKANVPAGDVLAEGAAGSGGASSQTAIELDLHFLGYVKWQGRAIGAGVDDCIPVDVR